jgi:hypothetical protein
MARKIGTPLTESEVTIHVDEECVLQANEHRYVFIDVLSPKIYRLSDKYGLRKLYVRFNTILHRGLYNTRIFYGLRAVDIDRPQEKQTVSVQLEIVVGKGKDTVRKNR